MADPGPSVVDILETSATLDVLAEALPNLVWIADAKGRIKYVNGRWRDYTGFDADGLSGERGAPRGIVHPDDLERTWKLWQRSLRRGTPYEISYRLREAKSGGYRWFLARAIAVRDDEGNIVEWAGTATDIEEQVRTSERTRFSSDAANVLSSSLDRKEIVEGFARLAVERFSDACIVLVREPDGSLTTAAIAHKDPVVERVLRGAPARLSTGGPVESVLETRRPVLVEEVPENLIRDAAVDAEHLAILLAMRMRSVIVVPLLVADALIGTLSFISSDGARPYDTSDLEIAGAVARQMALALENVRSFESERDASRELRFLSRVTDDLFATPMSTAMLQRFVEAVVSEVADFAAVLLLHQPAVFRVEAVAHRNEALRPIVERLRGQRVLRPEGERYFAALVGKHQTHVASQVSMEDLARGIQPYLLPVYSALRPDSAITVPLFIGDATFGALIAYSTGGHRTYGEGDRGLFTEIGRRASLALEHVQSSERERRLAQTLQEATLPAQLPKVEGAALSTVYLPSSTDAQVGGDWYDAYELGDGRLLLSIGDVTGRGLEASVIMGKLRHVLNVVAMYESDPARILDAAERVVAQRYPSAIATAFVAIYDPRRERLVYANAGHPYPIARELDGSLHEVKATGLPIGLRALAEPARSETRSMRGLALLTLYTDGLVEATRDIEEGEARLREVLATDAVLFVRNPAKMVAAACLSSDVRDDVALLILTFPGSVGWTFDAENARAAQSARAEFMAHLRSIAPTGDFEAAELVFGELVGNVVRHAPGPIDIALEWRDGVAVLHVTDRGPGFAGGIAPTVDPLSEAGRGLWLVQHFGHDMTVEPLRGFGSHVCVALPIGVRLERPPESPKREDGDPAADGGDPRRQGLSEPSVVAC